MSGSNERPSLRILVTGAGGFVGPALIQALKRIRGEVTVLPTGLESGEHPALGPIEALDVTDGPSVRRMISEWQPTHVINLAGLAAPAAARANEQLAWNVHVHGALNLGRAILETNSGCHLISIGSGLVYGDTARDGLPLNESSVLAPVDEYAVTKAAGDLGLGMLARRGLRAVRLRPFNHSGPGQTESFVLPAFAMQIARIEAGLDAPVMRIGNLQAERDFLDVRDVADAYARVVERADSLEAGTILNIASGVPVRIGDLLDKLLARSRLPIRVERDEARVNPNEIARIVGDASAAERLLDWRPLRRLDETVDAVLADCRARVAIAA